MRSGSVIDDVTLDDEEGRGSAILFTNQEIRKMLRLADTGPSDIFYDLGSGWAQNLIIALTEFHVKKAVGIEIDRERVYASANRLAKRNLSKNRASIVEENFEKVLAPHPSIKGVNPGEATVMFYGIETDKKILNRIRGYLRKGSRLLYYYNCLFPEILPDKVDFPFYMSLAPFQRPRSNIEWLSAIVQKEKSTIRKTGSPTEEELWDELAHDYDVRDLDERIPDYKRRLTAVIT